MEELRRFLELIQEEKMTISINGDEEALRVYFEDGISIRLFNLLVEILSRVLNIDKGKLTLHEDPVEGMYLLWVKEGS